MKFEIPFQHLDLVPDGRYFMFFQNPDSGKMFCHGIEAKYYGEWRRNLGVYGLCLGVIPVPEVLENSAIFRLSEEKN
ncbi:hypothetical protein Lepto7375DRAFT_7214 [Leptolyngbya sp. PCC 7375]|nr:hypothetical protein Lepto7375DRAFT_7214 [Leptolyngbya sp. PCC 7375]